MTDNDLRAIIEAAREFYLLKGQDGMTCAMMVDLRQAACTDEAMEAVRARLALAAQPAAEPIDMVLFCPKCGMQHVDALESHEDDWGNGLIRVETWSNPPHRSHLCHGCSHIWRPADVPTNGVAAVKTKGKNDSPIAQPARAGGDAPAGRVTDEQIVALKAKFGVTSSGRGIRELEQVKDFAHAVAALAAAPAPVRAGGDAQEAELIESMCARIKAADDAAADGDYMLDSDDCISVLRGTWQGPMTNDMPPTRAALVAAPQPAASASTVESVLHAFESKERGIPQGHIAAQLVSELRAALEAAEPAQAPRAAASWDASQIMQPGWNHVQQAFLDGAREARANVEAGEAEFARAADAYTKRVFEAVDPISEKALRTESWAAPQPAAAEPDEFAEKVRAAHGGNRWTPAPGHESQIKYDHRFATAGTDFASFRCGWAAGYEHASGDTRPRQEAYPWEQPAASTVPATEATDAEVKKWTAAAEHHEQELERLGAFSGDKDDMAVAIHATVARELRAAIARARQAPAAPAAVEREALKDWTIRRTDTGDWVLKHPYWGAGLFNTDDQSARVSVAAASLSDYAKASGIGSSKEGGDVR